MYYSIKIKLPKNKVKQYTGSNFVERNFSTLQDNEILALLNNFANHIAFKRNFNDDNISINFKQEKIIWNPTPTQKQFIENYYSNPNIQFADENTNPGENNTLEQNTGQQMYAVLSKSKLTLNEINSFYLSLGLRQLNCIRYIGKNYLIPQNINPIYKSKTKFLYPNPEVFEQMLRDFVRNNWIKLPLNTDTWNKNKYFNAYYFDGQYYSIPRTDDKKKFTSEYWDIFYKVADEIMPRLELQSFTQDSIGSLKENIYNPDSNIFPTMLAYEEYRKSLPDCYNRITMQQTKYFPEEETGINYNVPNYDKLPPGAKEELQKDVITSNSIANLVFRDIKDNQKELLNLENDFETEFKCSRDPRFKDFLLTLDNLDDKRGNYNIFRFLFNALKYRGIEEVSGIRSFNISTEHFKTEKTDIPEFQLFYNRGWYCKTNVMQDNLQYTNGVKLIRSKFSPENYKFDAVLQKNNKVYAILEYDGLDHFRPRNDNVNFVLRLTADQIKCAFVEYLKENGESIKIIRVPDYTKIQKTETWKTEFKQFILNKLNEYFGNQQNNETTNPLINVAYKIRKMIK